jgi:hypothetical protein
MDGEHHTAASKQGETRRSGQVRVANRQFEDYELYVTMEEEEVMLAMVEENPAEDKEDEEVLAAVVHYIMVHYEEKKGVKKKKKKYKHKSEQYQLEAEIKQFGEQGETAVTKKLDQFNKYRVFEPKSCERSAGGGQEESAIITYFSKGEEEWSNKGALLRQQKPTKRAYCKRRGRGANRALESVFITSKIDAKESRKVVTVDTMGAFLHTDNDYYIIRKMVGTLAELMVKTNPKLY